MSREDSDIPHTYQLRREWQGPHRPSYLLVVAGAALLAFSVASRAYPFAAIGLASISTFAFPPKPFVDSNSKLPRLIGRRLLGLHNSGIVLAFISGILIAHYGTDIRVGMITACGIGISCVTAWIMITQILLARMCSMEFGPSALTVRFAYQRWVFYWNEISELSVEPRPRHSGQRAMVTFSYSGNPVEAARPRIWGDKLASRRWSIYAQTWSADPNSLLATLRFFANAKIAPGTTNDELEFMLRTPSWSE
ncbi:hypothetical protein DFR75_1236 [Nocardia ignorata]|uniref:Uncharacterized protein n=1 Tax=Nocardia ignorata TaxID=145285 RepID=A0A4R6NX18_NOCIG|nr:hypothetical protein DFR75_1236 [Nocardia ignorata]